jgi:NAD(P)-dependent dehydrogenase (short-subunit alcohol dehydrogenase family)
MAEPACSATPPARPAGDGTGLPHAYHLPAGHHDHERPDARMEMSGSSGVVTGGSSGIGASAVRALAAEGVRCVIVDRNEELGAGVADEIGGVFVRGDVGEEDGLNEAVSTAAALAPLRFAVNAAGIGVAARTIDRSGNPHDLELFARVLRVNLVGVFNGTRLAAAAIARTEPIEPDGLRGVIVNIASTAAFDGQIGQAAYAASKAGIVGMTLPLARDLAVAGIRVNTIAPGLIDTPIYGEGPDAEAMKQHLGESVLLPHRLGVADEIAAMVVALIRNDYVNGETVRVDGGIRLPPR